jgi:penicillin-binding protein 2
MNRLLFSTAFLAACVIISPAQDTTLPDPPAPPFELQVEAEPVVRRATVVPEEEAQPTSPSIEPAAEPATETLPDPAAEPEAEPITERKAIVVPESEAPAPAKSESAEQAAPGDPEQPVKVKAVPADEDEPLTVKAVPGTSFAPVPIKPQSDRKPEKPKISVSLNTDPNARPLSLRVPAPRGQIVDRNGVSFARNRLAYYLGVQLPLKEGLLDSAVFDAAREPIAWIRRTLPNGWEITDEKILEHYRKRRWVPLMSASMVPDAVVEAIQHKMPFSVVLRPFYLRTYPNETMASHLLGYMGKNGAMASGDILAEELLWPPTIGKSGLEQRFDAQLTGTPGTWSVLYNAAGEKLSEDWVQRPKAGHTVVTSLDARFQSVVESEMRQNSVRGAFVIMDVKTGDVIAMSSNPGFNPNDWAYGMSQTEFDKYNLDPEHPLIPRAIQGLYPPASTFKVVTALAALDSGKVNPDTEFNCPKGMMFDRTWKWNHSHRDEGMMNVVRAIKRSCNPWFWQAARVSGAASLCAMGARMGYGDKTGICLPSMEATGTMPSPEYYQKRGGSLQGGILANVAIGQGEVLATPLQVCQMMAAVARGDAVPRPRLVRQIQDVDGNIVENFPPSVRATLTISKENLDVVRKGMRAVIADSDGTGTRASNNYVSMAGKTGTGEWHDSPKDYVAWFAGFIPAVNPEYAYAAVYEGDPGDEISGGKKVAPFVGDVFNKIYRIKKEGKEMPEAEAADAADGADGDDRQTRKAVASSGRKKRSGSSSGSSDSPAAIKPPAASPVTAAASEPPKAGLRGWWKRVTGKNSKPASTGGRP